VDAGYGPVNGRGDEAGVAAAVDPEDDASRSGGRRPAVRRIAAGVLTVLAAVLVYITLAAPREIGQLTPGALVRIPVEGIFAAALLLVLPARARRPVALAGGVALGLVTILKLFDMGFLSVLGRPFDPVLDWVLLGNARDFLHESMGGTGAVAAAVGAVLLAVALVVLTALAMRRLAGVVERHRRATTRTVAVLAVAWVACLALGVQIVAPVPVAARSASSLAYEKARQVPASLRDEREFTAQTAADPFRDTPHDQLLSALRGKDVVLTFVESYGRSAVEDPRIAPMVDTVLDAGTARLAAAGFSARSGWLTSPTFGGGSWLAHSTLHSGLKIDTQQRYRTLVSSDRLTLGSAFHRAGWETASVMPATVATWPEAAYFGIDRPHIGPTLGYRGPGFSFSPMPDQYTLAQFERLEHGRADRGPLMAQLELTSSHVPYTPIPKPVDWNALGDGSIFAPQVEGAVPADEILKDGDLARTAYRDATVYSLSTLIDYVERYGNDRTVLIFLGDHQPQTLITGEGASHDVPITIVAKDRSVLDRIADWKWDDGLRPGPRAPVWPMEAFRDRFLTAFDSPIPRS
jgi:hypothetical protein